TRRNALRMAPPPPASTGQRGSLPAASRANRATWGAVPAHARASAFRSRGLRARRRLVNPVRMRRGILVAGNYTHDLRRSASDRRELGGAAAYASAVLRAAGVDFAVVAKVGSDFLYPDRAPPALVVPGTSTTTFVYDDRTGERTAALLCAAPALAPEDLRETC